jgi:L-rhamnose-H+ transport protein
MGSLFGVLFHAVGGISAASFYVPYKSVKGWPWEVYWLIGGVFSWIIVPIVVSYLSISDMGTLWQQLDWAYAFWPFIFGLLWGIGGLTFGLAIRDLGVSLGISLALGLTAVFGTLIPPIFDGSISTLFTTTGGMIVLAGILLSLLGTYFIGKAGILRDREKKMGDSDQRSLKRGVLYALISGLLSACFAFGIAAGKDIVDLTEHKVRNDLFVNSFLFVFIMLGGFITNALFCSIKIVKNKSWLAVQQTSTSVITKNSLKCASGGTIWYTQFLFYGMGTTFLQELEFASWTLHMCFIIFFSTIWGIILKEWSRTSSKVLLLLCAGLMILIISTVFIGLGNSNFIS